MIRYSLGDDGRPMPGNQRRLDAQRPWLDMLPNNIRTVLDVGAGSGAHCDYFKTRGWRVTAIDNVSENFTYPVGVEYINDNVNDWETSRKFDLVFCSHVLEHIGDAKSFLTRLRYLVEDGGYLAVVVPPYEALCCDEHWNIGWNCSQLALLLVDCGFNCNQATFVELQTNVCGWGRKEKFEHPEFLIYKSLPYLPAGLAKQIISSGEGNLHLPDTVFADNVGALVRPKKVQFEIPDFDTKRSFYFNYGKKRERKDLIFNLDCPINLDEVKILFICLQEGDAVDLRIAVTDNRELRSSSEVYIQNKVGLTVVELSSYNFRGKDVDLSKIVTVVIGGYGQKSVAKCWLSIEGVGQLSSEPEANISSISEQEDEFTSHDFAAALGKVYFLENKCSRLEQDLRIAADEIERSRSFVQSLELLRKTVNYASHFRELFFSLRTVSHDLERTKNLLNLVLRTGPSYGSLPSLEANRKSDLINLALRRIAEAQDLKSDYTKVRQIDSSNPRYRSNFISSIRTAARYQAARLKRFLEKKIFEAFK